MRGRYFGHEKEVLKETGDYVMCSKSFMGGKQFKLITRYWIESRFDEQIIFSHSDYSKVEDKFIELTKEAE